MVRRANETEGIARMQRRMRRELRMRRGLQEMDGIPSKRIEGGRREMVARKFEDKVFGTTDEHG